MDGRCGKKMVGYSVSRNLGMISTQTNANNGNFPESIDGVEHYLFRYNWASHERLACTKEYLVSLVSLLITFSKLRV